MAEITGQPVLTGMELHDATVMQGFAWDDDGSTWVFSQVQQGGRAGGDLTLTQVDPDGNRLGFMRLTGFGHGVSIATERAGGDLWIWTETKSVLAPQTGNGFGCRIARFRWQNGATCQRQLKSDQLAASEN